MKLNKNVIDKIYRNNKFELPKIELKANNADVLIPYDLKLGFVDTTSEGVVFDNELDDYSQFERIFTGNEALLVKWTSSTDTTVKQTGLNKTLHKRFKVGDTYTCWVDKESAKTEFSNIENQRGDTFAAERITDVIDVYIKGAFSKTNIVRFFQLPSKFGDALYYVDSVDEYNDPNKNFIRYSKITLRSVNNRLADTGLSVKQYIQYAAPGEGYAKPQVVPYLGYREMNKWPKYDSLDRAPIGTTPILVYGYDGIDGYTKLIKVSETQQTIMGNGVGVVLDKDKLKNKPITSFQVEIFGKGVLSDIYFYGRPIKKLPNSQNEEIERPRMLLLNRALQADKSQKDATEPFARNTDYKYIRASRLVVESWYESWEKRANTQMNPNARKDYIGALELFYGIGSYEVNVNPLIRILGDVLTIGTMEWAHLWPTELNIKQDNNKMVKEIKTSDFSTLFLNNFFKNKSVPRLPISYKESIAWNLSMIPFIGGFLNKLTSGLVPGWRESTDLGGRNFNITGIIPTDLLDFYTNALMSPQKSDEVFGEGIYESKNKIYTAIPLNDLQSTSSPETISAVDYATILHYSFTDTFDTLDIHGQVIESGSTKDFDYVKTDNTPIIQWDMNQSVAVDNKNVAGYAIDLWGLHFLGDADIKITFFSGLAPVYTSKVKTMSKLTGSVRDWNTNYKISDWSAPAGVIVDNGNAYTYQAGDFTIGAISPEQEANLKNNFSQGTAFTNYAKDSAGHILVDGNGNPIRDYSDTGIPKAVFQVNRNGGKDTGVSTMTPQQIDKIKEDVVVLNPKRVIDFDLDNTNKSPMYLNFSEVFKQYKQDIRHIATFDNMSFDLKVGVWGQRPNGGVPLLGVINDFLSKTENYEDTKSFSNLQFSIVRNATGSFDLSWNGDTNKQFRLFNNTVVISITDNVSGTTNVFADKALENNGGYDPHSVWVEMTNIKVWNE